MKINYNGMELEEFTSDKPIAFPKGTKAVCWDGDEIKDEKIVIAYIPYLQYRVLTLGADDCDGPAYMACALLPDPPKPRRATNRELARWLAQGNGQIQYDDKTKNFGKSPDGERHKALKATTIFEYFGADDFYVGVDILVRKWSDTEWHEPTVDYLGIE